MSGKGQRWDRSSKLDECPCLSPLHEGDPSSRWLGFGSPLPLPDMRPVVPRRSHALALLLASLAACQHVGGTSVAPTSPDAHRLQRDIAVLADDRFEGRATGSAGNDSAAAFIAR